MRLLALLLLLPLLAAVAQEGTPLDHDPTVREMAGSRDLKSYDDGGEVYEMRMDGKQLSALRAFIWDHWKQKKRGFVCFTDSYIDSGNKAFIFIDLGDAGSRIVIRSVHYWAGGGVVRRDLFERPDVVVLEQAKPAKDDYGGDYVLVFRDKDGKTVKRL
jgi:hypothetical protein